MKARRGASLEARVKGGEEPEAEPKGKQTTATKGRRSKIQLAPKKEDAL